MFRVRSACPCDLLVRNDGVPWDDEYTLMILVQSMVLARIWLACRQFMLDESCHARRPVSIAGSRPSRRNGMGRVE